MKIAEIQISSSDRNAAANTWIDKVYSKYQSNPINSRQHIMAWGEGDDIEFATIELKPGLVKNTVEIAWISTYPHRSGVGTRAIQTLQQLAQEDNISLSLYPWDKGRISQNKLIQFYKKLGFKPIVPGAKEMIWHPPSMNYLVTK